MPDKAVFCNSPWYELHIFWDGSLAFCCHMHDKPYHQSQQNTYNIKSMTIQEWYDSDAMRSARLAMFSTSKVAMCNRCYSEELYSETSRRKRNLQKSVIFLDSNFDESYLQSPGHNKFELSWRDQGRYSGMPIDIHIDLGNYCNLACKMCRPEASSTIAVQQIKWGIESSRRFVGTDWTKDTDVWNRVITELAGIKNLRNVHFMGGETLITPKFGDFVDFMLENNRTDLNFSFVTNGTVFDQTLLDKLSKFNRIGIEVSIETLTAHNAYTRQGTDTDLVLTNIEKYLEWADGAKQTVTIRPAVSLLTIGHYDTLLEYCLQKNLVVKGLIVEKPLYLCAINLPSNVKALYRSRYQSLLDKYDLNQDDISNDYNESDPSKIRKIIKTQIMLCLNLLSTDKSSTDNEDKQLVDHCRKWDAVYGYNALELYPELADMFLAHGYTATQH